MPTPRISSRTLNTQDRIPVELLPSGLEYAIVESPAEIRWVDLQQESLEGFLHWNRGLAFGRNGELRWLKRSAGFHLVWISDGGAALPGADCSADLSPLEQDDEILLVGKFDSKEGQFIEGRIPGPLPYPPSWTFPRVVLLTRHYTFQDAAAERRLFRCFAVKEGKPR